MAGSKKIKGFKDFNKHGGLSIVPMPGFEEMARRIKVLIEQKRGIEVDMPVPTFDLRASGEPFLKQGKQHIGGHDCVVLTSGPGTAEMLINLQLLLGYLVGRRAGRICLITPYFPLGRSDKDEKENELALVPQIVHLLDAAAHHKLDRIISVDLHAPQAVMAGRQGFITEIRLISPLLRKLITDARRVSRHLCLYFPDAGADQRFGKITTSVCQELGISVPRAFGSKERLSSTDANIIDIYGDVTALKGAHVLAIDDEGATMGTLCKSARRLIAEFDAKKVWAGFVHGILCGDGPKLLAAPDCPIERNYITNTVRLDRPEIDALRESGRLHVIPIEDELAKIIWYHHNDESIRERR